VLAGLLDLLYPPRCLVCRGPGGESLCVSCRLNFTPVPPPFCLRCACPLPTIGVSSTCRPCRSGEMPFAAARALALFEGKMRTAIHRLKFEGRRDLGPVLGEMLAAFVRRSGALGCADVVVPVPLHAARRQERGYNPALLLAEPVARDLGAGLLADGLTRVAATGPQSELRREQRWANVAAAFAVPRKSVGQLQGRAVLLVDDVMTSGATAAECARTLLCAGVASVHVATLARAMPPPGRG